MDSLLVLPHLVGLLTQRLYLRSSVFAVEDRIICLGIVWLLREPSLVIREYLLDQWPVGTGPRLAITANKKAILLGNVLQTQILRFDDRADQSTIAT
ncbi:hypothetical protein EW145_g5049 [Phellinidium pouzarii]|uniref:Uncharacterized protein n=1 Tax=Phellinidium pouzarii TaxID=167371 RepID=A0A4S4L683_9AGAM|nr:hypothetical protein EW145_g5049 [Phellinidium pouzarii]